MLRLPILVAAGGINSAGRTSHRHAFRRLVLDALSDNEVAKTRAALGQLMDTQDPAAQLAGTLIRRIESSYFDPNAVPFARRAQLLEAVGADMAATQYVDGLSQTLKPSSHGSRRTRVELGEGAEVLIPGTRPFEVSAAGQLPTGFDPGAIYPSRNHPRAIQMAIFAVSDALADLGMSWEQLSDVVSPEAISVYMSSSMGQLDEAGSGGMLQARALGKKTTSKQCPFGFAEMPGDFLNAYVLQSIGQTGPALGACATFLYNLQRGVQDIRAGRARLVVVGAAEAPIQAEIMEGYAAMGALATDKGLRALDGLADDQPIDARRACRPFGDNCGFTMAESAQVVILMDDELALTLGAPMLAAVPDVFVHADGAKKSVTGPGVGNYVTMARATALMRAIVGEQRLAAGGMVHAHGTGTPQNRVTESAIFNDIAAAFGIDEWPVVAVKSFIGHSLGAASGDQLSAALGIWDANLLPAIKTIDAIAPDVATQHLSFVLQTTEHHVADYALINSKGFGGNNATAALLSPKSAHSLVREHHGASAFKAWQTRNEALLAEREALEARRLAGDWAPRYIFNEGVVDVADIAITQRAVTLGNKRVNLQVDLPQGWSLN